MGAPLGFKTFATGDVLTAADANGYLMQGVWTFADAAARTAAVTSPQEGNMSYLKDTNSVEYYSGSAWTAVSGSAAGSTLVKRASFSSVASTTTTFDSVFTTTYANYMVVIDTIYAATPADDLQIQMRYGGTTETGANYFGVAGGFTIYGATSISGSNASTQVTLATGSGASTNAASGVLFFSKVGNGSQVPGFSGLLNNIHEGVQWTVGGQTQTSRTYDGFLLKSASTNITGTVSVYGLAK